MTMIIVFGSAFVLSFGMFGLKGLELRNRHESFVLRQIRRFDPLAHKLIENLKFRILQVIQTLRFLVLVHIPAAINRRLLSLKESMMKEYKDRQEVLMGRKDITNKGAVSFFLKKIDETKRITARGEINETL